jgi:hypothetical protein
MDATRSLRDLFAVVVFGDGTIPEILLHCMQFRLVADRTAAGSVGWSHLMQLQRHIAPSGCRTCHGYLLGRLAERHRTLRP